MHIFHVSLIHRKTPHSHDITLPPSWKILQIARGVQFSIFIFFSFFFFYQYTSSCFRHASHLFPRPRIPYIHFLIFLGSTPLRIYKRWVTMTRLLRRSTLHYRWKQQHPHMRSPISPISCDSLFTCHLRCQLFGAVRLDYFYFTFQHE